MPVLTEGRHTAEFIASEANGTRSREVVTIDTGALAAGTVLARLTGGANVGKYVALTIGGADGAGTAAGVLYAAADATAADAQQVAMVRDCEVADASLIWPAGITGGQKTTAIGQLAALGIIVR